MNGLYLIRPQHQLKYTQSLSAEEVEQIQCYLIEEGFSSLQCIWTIWGTEKWMLRNAIVFDSWVLVKERTVIQ